jgi:hypothetical protein
LARLLEDEEGEDEEDAGNERLRVRRPSALIR